MPTETGEVSFNMNKFSLLLLVLAGLALFAGACGTEDGVSLPTVDTVPPVPPVNVQVGFESNSITIRWSENAEIDLAGYKLYKSSLRDGPFGQETSGLIYCPWYFDHGLPMEMTYYKVTAVDQSGNESAFSQVVGFYYNTDTKRQPVAPAE
jgi:fibronectin type 3 domain-containing protein